MLGQEEKEMSEQTPKYHLYASRNLAVPDGVEYSLIPSCSGGRYILLYTDKVLENGCKQLDESVNLEPEERAWLTSVKSAVNNRYLQEHEQEYAEVFGAFCDTLEKELAEEKKRLTDSTSDDKKGTDDNA